MRSAAALACALWLAGCGEAPAPELPPGASLAARRPALAQLLAHASALERTPLARQANRLARELPHCPRLEAHAESGRLLDLLEALRCAGADGTLAPLRAELASQDLAFARSIGPSHLRGTARLDASGGVVVTLALPDGAADGALELLIPGPEPPGPGLLSGRERLLHARARPRGGLDVASLVPSGSQGEQLFRLKSRLFAGLVLDGTWEAAVYLPEPAAAMPRAALALGFERREAAVGAMESFVDELLASWPVRRSFFATAGAEGTCLLDLRVLPELAPCYVATERALVVGWNPSSLRQALDGEPAADAALAAGGGILELARLPEADSRLAPDARRSPLSASLPWRRLVFRRSTAEEPRVRIALEPRGGA